MPTRAFSMLRREAASRIRFAPLRLSRPRDRRSGDWPDCLPACVFEAMACPRSCAGEKTLTAEVVVPSVQIVAEALDARAGLFENFGRGRVGDAEIRAEPERRAVHDRDAFRLEQLAAEILVGLDRRCPTEPSCRSCRRRTDRRRRRLPATGTSGRAPGSASRRRGRAAPGTPCTNFGMKSCGPVSASVAAHCAMVQAPDVCWPWIITIASTSFFGPAP